MIYPINYGIIPTSSICLNKKEVAARLQVPLTSEILKEYSVIEELEAHINCKYSSVRSDLEFCDENIVNFGIGEIESRDLSRNLGGCGSVFVFAVTLGCDVDRFLKKLSLISPSQYFIADAYASAYAEAAADKAEALIRGNLKCHPRYSPGYGDLDISCQEKVLNFINAGKLLGINLGSTFLMSPMKTVTAIEGIENE